MVEMYQQATFFTLCFSVWKCCQILLCHSDRWRWQHLLENYNQDWNRRTFQFGTITNFLYLIIKYIIICFLTYSILQTLFKNMLIILCKRFLFDKCVKFVTVIDCDILYFFHFTKLISSFGRDCDIFCT